MLYSRRRALGLITAGAGALASPSFPQSSDQHRYRIRPLAGWNKINGFVPQSGSRFTCTFEAIPLAAPMSGVVALNNGPGQSFTQPCLVRFGPSGTIEASSGSSYAPSSVTYAANVRYFVRWVIDLQVNQHSVYVRREGVATEQTVGVNLPFRVATTTLDNWSAVSDSNPGGMFINDFEINRDRFNITKLFPTVGYEWVSRWDNGYSRSLTSSGLVDPYDPDFVLRGDGPNLAIDGAGIATMSGLEPRMYVYAPHGDRKFKNVEVTFYGWRTPNETPHSTSGLIVGVRSEHQDADYNGSPCHGRTLYGRLLYAGHANIKKELAHVSGGLGYVEFDRPDNGFRATWSGPNGTMEPSKWIGMKLVCRNVNTDSAVSLQIYRDMSGGVGGGNWQPIFPAEVVDAGDWPVTRYDVQGQCGVPPTDILLHPGTSVFIRNTVVTTQYKWFSIREIAPA
ncbi:MAG TPA: hypothetical protein VER03_14935 [Bryobacteraceae bacterium]|nr:hypothetical protein [Bryobacteraceae bacterium]